jgi:hypothetical protein
MSSRAADLLLSNVFPGAAPPAGPLQGARISMKLRATEAFAAPAWPASRKRTSIYDLHPSVHCSIIGTCLSAPELRRLMVKLCVPDAALADDHALHKQAVALAGSQQEGGKLINKALDRRHQVAIRQCVKLSDESELLRYWEDALKRGDIPGAYWAILSHAAATEAIMRRAFGDVHMLSHMVGAANRADIRRLRQLEEENGTLNAKIDSQQRHLRDGFAERDKKIRLLNDALSRALAEVPASTAHADKDAVAACEALADMGRRLDREIANRERLEAGLGRLTVALTEAERGREAAEQDKKGMHEELRVVEARIGRLLAGEVERAERESIDTAPRPTEPETLALALPQLAGCPVLYVGGRPHQVPQLRALVEQAGGVFLYHDGGVEHASATLPGLVSRASCAAIPIDCVSHHAMAMVKRLCRQAGKPFIPLRTSSLASLLAGLSRLSHGSDTVAATRRPASPR